MTALSRPRFLPIPSVFGGLLDPNEGKIDTITGKRPALCPRSDTRPLKRPTRFYSTTDDQDRMIADVIVRHLEGR